MRPVFGTVKIAASRISVTTWPTVAVPIGGPRADRARRVADVLRQQIHAGAYPDGLPPESELAAEFFVSRNTIREALTVLKNEGLIERGPKVGTHVAQRKVDHELDVLLGLKETFKDLGEVRNEVRAAMPVAAPPSVASRLRLETGEPAVFVERLRYLGDLPLSLDLTYLTPDIGSQILCHPLESPRKARPVRAHRAGERAAAGLGVAGAGSDSRRRALGGHPAGPRRGGAAACWSGSPASTTADPLTWNTSGCVVIESPCART